MIPENQAGPANPYGTQQTAKWKAGDDSSRPLLCMQPAPSLWQVSVIGPVSVALLYGTKSTARVLDLIAPLFFCVPGRVELSVAPLDSSTPTIALVTVTPVSAAGLQSLRQVVDAALGPVPLHENAREIRALTASTVEVSGTAVSLAVGESFGLISGSVLTAGKALLELSL